MGQWTVWYLELVTAWNGYYERYRAAQASNQNAEAYAVIGEARRNVAADSGPDRWKWLVEALGDPERRWFVASVFARQPVPSRLFEPMIQAALLAPVDASHVQHFIVPLAETFGGDKVSNRLRELAKDCSSELRTSIGKAGYWAGGRGGSSSRALAPQGNDGTKP